MKRIALTLTALVTTITIFAQTKGDYESALNKVQNFYNHQQTDSIFEMFSDKIKSNIPLDKTTTMISNLHDQFGEMKSYELIKQKDVFNFYKVAFKTESLSLTVVLDKENKFETF